MGRTGSGKTHFACWLLSLAAWPTRPAYVIDYKHDELIDAIPGREEIEIAPRRMPRAGGVYVVRPRPDQDDAVESFIWRVWKAGHAILYVDEGHMLPDQGALKSVLTQGRSKQIAAIVLTQRPSWVNRFVFSEADFYSVFHLNDRRDQKTIESFVPVDLAARPLPPRHSWYYEVARNRLFHMLQAPGKSEILERFEARHPRRLRKEFV
jgi:DNA helicase HerA-like ATPase